MANTLNPQQQQIFNDLMSKINGTFEQFKASIQKAQPAQASGQPQPGQAGAPNWLQGQGSTWQKHGLGGLLKRAWGGLSSLEGNRLSLAQYIQLKEQVDEALNLNLISEETIQLAVLSKLKQQLSALIMQAFVQMAQLQGAELPTRTTADEF
jgi:hypothetical protein